MPRYRAAWEEHQGTGALTLQGDAPMIGLVVHLVVAETDDEALAAARPAWEKYRWNLAAPRRLEAEKRNLTQFMSTKDGSFGFVGDRRAGLAHARAPAQHPTLSSSASISRSSGRIQIAWAVWRWRAPSRRCANTSTSTWRPAQFRLLVSVGRSQPRAGVALSGALHRRGDATLRGQSLKRAETAHAVPTLGSAARRDDY